ncbi:MAG: hypothetical protein ABEH56_07835 [Salinirussus sp.]
MNVDSDSRHRSDDANERSIAAESADSRSLGETVSTRVLIDASSTHRCTACGDSIREGTRYKCLTVREADGVSEYHFCDEDCLVAREERRPAAPAA